MKIGNLVKSIMAAAFIAGTAMSVAKADSESGYWQDIQKSGTLRCGAAVAPPHVIRDPQTGEFSGTFVDLCKQFADVLGVKAQMVETSWDNIVAGLQANRWDMSMALNQNPKRGMAIAFSEPVVQFQVSGIYDKANPKFATPPKSLADLDKAGTTIIIMSGTSIDGTLTPQIKNATILRLPDIDATRLALSSHRGDILMDDGDSNALFAATAKDRWATLLPNPAISKQGIAFGLRRSASYADIQALNYFITEKNAIGEIDKIAQGYVDKLASQGK
ncbi:MULTISPECIES: transporter substrate-binding domain-containing protein [unclassified Mesorhizobium]|uniref:substrate-binding periplasmic protein n=1 Tax=unclassified Mesorhizobium TaxID=325217 RepID=UPI0024156F65|nr:MULTISPECIES: transporter substrate-binding domain-containing protein [unclassified Mesorhizobium]MDG4889918.1 transporter substrate-binding domain-containing protein [Mesorhizobium sp. WSM4887]MDG4904061.1 transporter substrate-binding domain-containing protein [Mesorhizobium sp. WSM4962]MDG4909088.1 transporter substrate-binding domain-containing protein [Mesorhizobium sp. WSM4898]MDG4921712.1 transporter substrate-binding domain-containing protein [Mesorhizobium sp. WSM4989]